MFFYAITGLINALTSIILGSFVLFKNSKNYVNIKYAFFNFMVAIWSFGYFFWLISKSPSLSLFCAKILISGAIMIPVIFLDFVVSWVKLHKKHESYLLFSYILSFIFLILNFLGYLIVGVEKRNIFLYWPVPSILFHFFLLFFLINAVYACYLLWVVLKRSTGGWRNQIKLVLIGMIIGYAGGVTNFFLWYNIQIPPFGNGLAPIYMGMMTYAILKYRAMDIEVFIKKSLVFTGVFSVVLGVISLIFILTQNLIGQFYEININLTLIICVLVSMVLYDPTRKILINITDKYLFQKKYDYSKLLKDASMGLAKINSLKHQLKLISHFLTMRARISAVSIYMPKESGESFSLVEVRKNNNRFIEVEEIRCDSVIMRYLKSYKNTAYIKYDEIMDMLDKNVNNKKIKIEDLKLIRNEFEYMGAELIIASYYESDLKGLLVLGKKKSDEIYRDSEISVISVIAQESALAIENARLFDEKIDRTIALEKTNQELENSNLRLQETQSSLIIAEKNATMVGMAKAIGHEVYNPLCTVEGRVDLLRKKIGKIMPAYLQLLSPEEKKIEEENFDKIFDYISRVEKSARRIKVAVQTLTNILKESKGEMTPLNFLVLWKESVQATRFSTYDENLSFCEFEEDIKANLLINGNLEQLMQVFTNLIKNAYEAMDQQSNREIKLVADIDKENQGMARIEFIDNGPGMTEEVQRKVFQQGYSTKEQDAKKGIGTSGQGQGLYICKHIIESVHKGVMVVISEIGKGTKFVIKLPLVEEELTALPHKVA